MADERPRERWLREAEVTRLLEACSGPLGRGCCTPPPRRGGRPYGLRLGELLNLRWEQIDMGPQGPSPSRDVETKSKKPRPWCR